MGYMNFISSILTINWTAATMAMNRNEPYAVLIMINSANMLLPPDEIDGGKVKQKGYRVDLSKVLPTPPDTTQHNKMYLTESMGQDAKVWQAVFKAFGLVSEAVSRYAHDKKDDFLQG